MKRALGAAAIMVAALALAACSSISSGFITEKHYEPASSYTTMYCASYNSKGGCVFYAPMTHQVPEHWVFELRNGDDTGSVDVDPNTYESYDVGDAYSSPKEN